MSYAVLVATEAEAVQPVGRGEPLFEPAPAASGHPVVRDTTTGEVTPGPCTSALRMNPGARIAGPAILAEDETSTLVGPGWTAMVNGLGYVELTR